MEEALLLPVVDSLSIYQSRKPIGNKVTNHLHDIPSKLSLLLCLIVVNVL